MDKLIFDRTSTDVEYARNNPSAEEWLKGCYNYIDLNRVEEWCKYLSNLLNFYGYVNLISEKTDWNANDIQTVQDMERYLNNIKVLMNTFVLKSNTPELPDTMNKLNYIQANNIEKILFDIDELTRAMPKTFVHSGVAGVGQNRVWQQRFRRPIEALNYKVYGNSEQVTREGYNMVRYYDSFRTGSAAGGITPSINSDGTLQVVVAPANANYLAHWCSSSENFSDIENQIAEDETFTIAFTIKKSKGSTGVPKIYIKNGMGYYSMIGEITEEYSEIYYTGIWKDANSINIHIGWEACIGTFTIKNWMIKKGAYQPIEPYGVMPSPDYPSEVYGLGRNGAIELKQKIGDNLLDVSKLENGYINTYNGYLAASQYTDATDFIKLKANQKYVYTYEYENLAHTNDRGYGIYDLTKNFKWGANYIMTSKKFEITPEEDGYIRISIDKGCTNLMFNEGEALPYVPFIEVNKTIDLTNHEPLMKVGDVEDYIDYDNSRIVRNIGKVVYDGSSDEDIQVNEYGTNAYRMTPLHKYNIVSELATNNCMNNQFLVVSYNDRAINKNNILYLAKDYITVRNTNFSTLQEFKTWLSSNPLIVYYQLAEPYYEEINLPLIQKIPGEYSLTAYDEYLDGRVEKE